MIEPGENIPDRIHDEPEYWSDEDQDELDDYLQAKEDLAQDEN